MRKIMGKMLIGILSLLIATLVVWEGQAQSQEAFPTKPIEIIVPWAPGGGADLSARALAFGLNKKLGVPVNTINKPGGNTIPGILSVYNANPDGYTVLGDGNSTSSMLVAIKDVPFKIMDRTFIGKAGTNAHIFLVAANSPFKSLKDVAAEAKRDPGSFTWTMLGAGTDSVGLTFRQFFKAIDVDVHKTKAISVAGGGPAAVMVAGGHAILGVATVTSATASLRGGTLKGLAVTSMNRHPDWPDVPTTAELGYPSVNVVFWTGISGPPKLPAFIVARWEKALEEILKDPEVIAKLKNIGVTPTYLNSQATRDLVIREIEDASKLWGLVKSGG